MEVFNKMRDMILRLESENDNLARDYALVVSQRDEARKMYCVFVAADNNDRYFNDPEETPQDVALRMGWDGLTFDEEVNNGSIQQDA